MLLEKTYGPLFPTIWQEDLVAAAVEAQLGTDKEDKS
jgi:hypothetical protein